MKFQMLIKSKMLKKTFLAFAAITKKALIDIRDEDAHTVCLCQEKLYKKHGLVT